MKDPEEQIGEGTNFEVPSALYVLTRPSQREGEEEE